MKCCNDPDFIYFIFFEINIMKEAWENGEV